MKMTLCGINCLLNGTVAITIELDAVTFGPTMTLTILMISAQLTVSDCANTKKTAKRQNKIADYRKEN